MNHLFLSFTKKGDPLSNTKPIEVNSSKEFREGLVQTERDLLDFEKKYGAERVLESIKAQLKYLKEWTSKGEDIKDPKLRDINMGIMASHYIESEDPNLSMNITMLSYYVSQKIDD